MPSASLTSGVVVSRSHSAATSCEAPPPGQAFVARVCPGPLARSRVSLPWSAPPRCWLGAGGAMIRLASDAPPPSDAATVASRAAAPATSLAANRPSDDSFLRRRWPGPEASLEDDRPRVASAACATRRSSTAWSAAASLAACSGEPPSTPADWPPRSAPADWSPLSAPALPWLDARVDSVRSALCGAASLRTNHLAAVSSSAIADVSRSEAAAESATGDASCSSASTASARSLRPSADRALAAAQSAWWERRAAATAASLVSGYLCEVKYSGVEPPRDPD